MANFYRLVLPVSERHEYGIRQYVLLCVWLLFFSVQCLRFIQAVACRSSFCFVSKCSPLCDCSNIPVTYPCVSHSAAGGGLFRALHSVEAVVWTFLLVSLDEQQRSVHSLSVQQRECWVTGSSVVWLDMEKQLPKSCWAKLHPHQQLLWARIAPHSTDTSCCDSLPLVFLLVVRVSQFNFNLRFLSRAMALIAFSCVCWLIEQPFCEMFVQIFYLSYWLNCLLLIIQNSLYIFRIWVLCQIYVFDTLVWHIVDTFVQSAACLLTFSMMYFWRTAVCSFHKVQFMKFLMIISFVCTRRLTPPRS